MHGLAARGHDVTMLVCRACRAGSRDTVDVRRELDYVLAPWRRPRRGFQAVVHDQGVVRRALSEGVDAALVWHMRGIMKTSLRLLHDAGIPVLYMLHDRWVLYERPGPWLWPWSRIDRLGLATAREAVGSFGQRRVELRTPPIEQEGLVCFASHWLQEEHARLGWRPRNARVVPSGVETQHLRAARKAPPTLPPRRILYAGRVHPTKGLHVLIEALATSPGPHLTIAGLVDDRPYLERLQRQARSLGVESRISWLGELPRERVFGLLGSHDVFVYPSIAPESGWLGLLEGLAAGAIVVTSAPGAPRELVVHGRNTLLFPPGEALGLANQLRRLRDDPTLGEGLLRGARETVEHQSLTAALDQVEALLSDASKGVPQG